jgi:AMP nucleosidase
MRTIKRETIVKDWLPRYTGMPLKDFGEYVLLTNFNHYVELFCQRFGVEVADETRPMQAASAGHLSIINFGMGSAVAATVMDLLSAIDVKAVLFLGKCGGLKKKTQIGDFVLPIAAIRGEGTSNDYLDPMIPALPSFALQRSISSTIINYDLDYWTGTVYTTNRRVWEHDTDFREYLRSTRAMAIDMETATVFVVGFTNEIPRGALLLVSDNPMIPEGVKMSAKDEANSKKYVETHLSIGIDALEDIAASGDSVKHLRFEE